MFPQKATQLFSTLITIHVSRAADQHIRVISEGSCGTEKARQLSYSGKIQISQF